MRVMGTAASAAALGTQLLPSYPPDRLLCSLHSSLLLPALFTCRFHPVHIHLVDLLILTRQNGDNIDTLATGALGAAGCCGALKLLAGHRSAANS